MSLLPLLILIFIALIIGSIANQHWRTGFLFIASILAIYWLQPATPIRHLDFWLPTVCLAISVFTWIFTRSHTEFGNRVNLAAGTAIITTVLLVGLTRYLGPLCCLTPSAPPAILQIVIALLLIALLSFITIRFLVPRAAWMITFSILIIALFVVLKSDALSTLLSAALRALNSQSAELASPFDIRWLGFSYVAFRLLHTLRDRLSGRLPDLTLQEFMIYVLFFPAYTAGPIDRVQRFIQDLRQPSQLSLSTTLPGMQRILLGIFSKFVLADGLALFALSNTNASQVGSSGWLWVMLYAFALRIFFDFSGYTSIAIGMGQLLGIHLPENFEHPYLKPNLTLFWNSWHITLAQWFRAYFFNPLTRSLRASPKNIPLPVIIFIGQLSTFVLIGLWHGISWNFAIWGAWHGLGLFVHNRWTDLLRPHASILDNQPVLKRLIGAGGTFLTFNYVSLGWVWFALSTPPQSWNTFLKLFGLA